MNKQMAIYGAVAIMTLGIYGVTQEDSTLVEAHNRPHHVVQSGDTLWRISTDNGYGVDEVANYNERAVDGIIYPQDIIFFPEETQLYFPKEEVVYESVNTGYWEDFSDYEFNFIAAIVQQEAVGLTLEEHLPSDAYESMLAVMSAITNRADVGGWYGNTVLEVITRPGQFESYGEEHYVKHFGNITETTKRAVNDGLNGVKNHNYLNFRSAPYAAQHGYYGEAFGGNIYFND